jgi:hypothetical protein
MPCDVCADPGRVRRCLALSDGLAGQQLGLGPGGVAGGLAAKVRSANANAASMGPGPRPATGHTSPTTLQLPTGYPTVKGELGRQVPARSASLARRGAWWAPAGEMAAGTNITTTMPLGKHAIPAGSLPTITTHTEATGCADFAAVASGLLLPWSDVLSVKPCVGASFSHPMGSTQNGGFSSAGPAAVPQLRKRKAAFLTPAAVVVPAMDGAATAGGSQQVDLACQQCSSVRCATRVSGNCCSFGTSISEGLDNAVLANGQEYQAKANAAAVAEVPQQPWRRTRPAFKPPARVMSQQPSPLGARNN